MNSRPCIFYQIQNDDKMIINGKIFGEVIAHELSIEYQKRCLPHAHILIWLETPIRPDDHFVSVEIPGKERDPELYNVVMKNMIYFLLFFMHFFVQGR